MINILNMHTDTASNASRPNEIGGSAAAATNYCHDPNGLEGVCRHIRQCPIILKDFVRLVNQRDESYILYIRQSNAICAQTINDPIICCPMKHRTASTKRLSTTPIPVKSTPGQLLTPEQGCGLGKPIRRPRTINPRFQTAPGKLNEIWNKT